MYGIDAGVKVWYWYKYAEALHWGRYRNRAFSGKYGRTELVQVWCRYCRALAWVFKYGLGVGMEVWQ